MLNSTKRWHIQAALTPEVDRELEPLPPIIRQIVYNRGYQNLESAQRYLDATQPLNTEPYRMLGVPAAVDRIRFAIDHGERIVVYGDYDADGVTATALLVQTLASIGAQALPYIPDRFEEGYGLNTSALKSLRDQGTDLVITVDCGIRSPDEVDFARSLGMDLIISDHHTPGDQLPHANAIINPNQPDDEYPDKNLSGVGLAFKLASELLRTDRHGDLQPEHLLDLVALGTVADMVPLIGENRALVRAGLATLQRPHRQGIMALIGVAGISPANIKASDISFILAPRLNAAGRLTSAQAAYRLLLTQDLHEAGRLAQTLDNHNRERQKITRQIQARAEEIALRDTPDPMLIFAADAAFNPGVIGLAASRLANRYYRPAIVAHQGETVTRGSCRSIPELHITEALDQCANLLVRYGGHAAAAGFTVNNDTLPAFILRLAQIVTDRLGDLDLVPTLQADAEVSLNDLNQDLLIHLTELEPTGTGNAEAVFISRNLRAYNGRTVGRDNSHLKFSVTDGKKHFDAIAFRQGSWYPDLPEYVDLLYKFETNEYRGEIYQQLNVQDIKPSS